MFRFFAYPRKISKNKKCHRNKTVVGMQTYYIRCCWGFCVFIFQFCSLACVVFILLFSALQNTNLYYVWYLHGLSNWIAKKNDRSCEEHKKIKHSKWKTCYWQIRKANIKHQVNTLTGQSVPRCTLQFDKKSHFEKKKIKNHRQKNSFKYNVLRFYVKLKI